MKGVTVREFYDWICAHHCEDYEFGYTWELGPFCPFGYPYELGEDFRINEEEKRVYFFS